MMTEKNDQVMSRVVGARVLLEVYLPNLIDEESLAADFDSDMRSFLDWLLEEEGGIWTFVDDEYGIKIILVNPWFEEEEDE